MKGTEISTITNVLRRIGHKRDMRSVFFNAPEYLRRELEDEGFTGNAGTTLKNDFALVFVSHKGDLDAYMPLTLESTKPGDPIWIAYPRAGRVFGKKELTAQMRLYDYEPMGMIRIDTEWAAIRFRPINPVTVKTPDDETDTLKPPSW